MITPSVLAAVLALAAAPPAARTPGPAPAVVTARTPHSARPFDPWLARHGIVAPRCDGKVVVTVGGRATGRWAPWLERHGIAPRS